MSKFATETYIFDPRPSYPLQLVAKRFFEHASTSNNVKSPVTLVFAHGTGFHKELWEPVIDDLTGLVEGQQTEKGAAGEVKVADIWTVDCPNHGDAAVLNAEALKDGYGDIFGWEEYARILHLFINGQGILKPINGNSSQSAYSFAGRNVVGIGHSMGSVALALSLTYAPSAPSSPFIPSWSPVHAQQNNTITHPIKSLILVEPMIMAHEFGVGATEMLVSGALRRRDTWPSRAEAAAVLGKSLKKQKWDERCVRVFLEHGLRPVKEGEDAVTLKCTKQQEAACYRDPVGSPRLYNGLGALVKVLPVHVMYGAVDDYIPAEVKTDVIEHRAGGADNLASYARVPGGGHLVPLQNPTGLAEKIFDALRVHARMGGARVVAGAGVGSDGEAGKAKL